MVTQRAITSMITMSRTATIRAMDMAGTMGADKTGDTGTGTTHTGISNSITMMVMTRKAILTTMICGDHLFLLFLFFFAYEKACCYNNIIQPHRSKNQLETKGARKRRSGEPSKSAIYVVISA